MLAYAINLNLAYHSTRLAVLYKYVICLEADNAGTSTSFPYLQTFEKE